ncbi:MAG: methylmalonyl Co-A mutase-associated GTPase MeaB [Acidobacteria bacterium]|nr:methylmalonyl Co-A mutase-associated GTPase MeaB [Acidobacteriota bacterium]
MAATRFDSPRALARAATIIENRGPGAGTLLAELFPLTGRAAIYGITGPPGAGKSTLLNQLIRELRRAGQSVGVLAVDPTSPFTGGALLGDRIRMQDHHGDPGVFVRSMAARGHLGGLARATTDLALLLDAAGFDVVLVETVGVGQDEVEIARLAGVTAVVLVPGLGDDVQMLKAGIMEIADVFIINKADQPGTDRLEREIQAALSLSPRREWTPPVIRCVATEGQGIDAAWAALVKARDAIPRRAREVETWRLRLRELLGERLLEQLPPQALDAAAGDVAARRRDPYAVVNGWIEQFFGGTDEAS